MAATGSATVVPNPVSRIIATILRSNAAVIGRSRLAAAIADVLVTNDGSVTLGRIPAGPAVGRLSSGGQSAAAN